MKHSFYFDHDYNARNDSRVLELRAEYGWEGYGVYFALIETMCECNGEIKRGALAGLALGLSMDKTRLSEMIDFMLEIGLFTILDGVIKSGRVVKHLEFRKMLSDSGSKGGRGNKKPPFSPPLAPLEAGKERIEDESKEIPLELVVVSPVAKPKKTVCDFYKEQIKISNDDPEYKKFVSFLYGKSEKNQERCVNILSLRDQLKYYQFKKLLILWNEKLNKKSLHEIVLDLENFKQAGKKYCSVGKTLTNWIKSDQQFTK